MKWGWILFAPLAIVGLAVFIVIGGGAVWLLWNWLLPPLFGWSEITFWQALAMLALCRILFGGFGRHGDTRSRIRDRVSTRVGERMEERCKNMTPEERERLRQRVRDRWGFGPSTGEKPETTK